jgi:hypothetical protein
MRHTEQTRQERTSTWYAGPRTQRLWRRPPILDAAALVAFAAIGMLSHDGGFFLAGFVRDALPLLAAWFAVALAVGTYRRPSLRRLILTWAVAVPLAVLVRGVALGRHADAAQAAFLATSMAFTLLFILGLRALAGRVSR